MTDIGIQKKDLNHVWSQKNLIKIFRVAGIDANDHPDVSDGAGASQAHSGGPPGTRWSTKSLFVGFGVLKIPCMGNGVSLSRTVIL